MTFWDWFTVFLTGVSIGSTGVIFLWDYKAKFPSQPAGCVRYCIVNGILRPFQHLRKGDVFDMYEPDGTLVMKNILAESDAYLNANNIWTVNIGKVST
jgi:hypothetical protein